MNKDGKKREDKSHNGRENGSFSGFFSFDVFILRGEKNENEKKKNLLDI